ncbi:MAG: glycosyltransferase [Candidatus Bathyarchaeota archaeon]|nr:glycosyltransferase [Candidatus Bathyarchaeota archaeon]
MPLITAGLCVKNNERTVGNTVKSIISSDYPHENLEVIVVDGMSEDKTENIVREHLGKSALKYKLLHDNGRGLAYARQMVLENCQGKYVIWVDGDNTIPSQLITRHVTFMERNFDFGASSALIIPEGKCVVAKLQGYQWLITSLFETRIKKYANQNPALSIGMQGVVCRVDAMKEVNGFDLRIEGAGEDIDLFIRMQRKGWQIGRTPHARINHNMRGTWRSLLNESIWWGYGRHYLSHKYYQAIGPLITKRSQLIPYDIVELTLYSAKLFKDPACLILPFHYLLRRIGFFIGFNKAHNKGYGHDVLGDITEQDLEASVILKNATKSP